SNFLVRVLIPAFGDFERCGRTIKLGFGNYALLNQPCGAITIVSGFVEHRASLSNRGCLLGIDVVIVTARRQSETRSRLRQRSFRLLHAQTVICRIKLADDLSLRDDTAEV